MSKTPPPTTEELVVFANQLADAAREVILPFWRQPIKVESKLEHDRPISESPVTIADRLAEKTMRQLIEQRYPSHGIYGEEYGHVRMDAIYIWVLDPIDGTKSFITGKPLFGTLIACLFKGNPIIGVIDQCVLDERWVGVVGSNTTYNGKPIKTSGCTELKESMMYATTPHMFAKGEEADKFKEMCDTVKRPLYGADCYAYAILASSFGADIVVEADLGLYDYCALVPIVEGAGGIMTDWCGRRLTLKNHEVSKGRVLACANEGLHREAIVILGKKWRRKYLPSAMVKNILYFSTGIAIGVLCMRPRRTVT